MAKIEKVELRMVDLVPKVKRTDAIQSFVSQETPIVTITDADGMQHTFRRDGDKPKVEVHDPLAPHRELLKVYTDKDIHDLTAYLVTLK